MNQWLKTKLEDDKKIDDLTNKINDAIKNMNLNIIFFGKQVREAADKAKWEWLEEHYQKPFFRPYLTWLDKNYLGKSDWIKLIKKFLAEKGIKWKIENQVKNLNDHLNY